MAIKKETVVNNKRVDINEIDISKIDNLDTFFRLTQPINSISKAVSNSLYGLNHEKVKGVVPENRDSQGYVFFTRPQLNLSTVNLVNLRKFYSLMTTDNTSIQRYVRMMLDPRLGYDGEENMNSPLINNRLAFIPVLTNTIKSLSGWPDIVLPTFTSKSGLRKEQVSMPDGVVDIYESFDLDASFRNTKDEPIIQMMQTWIYYMAYAFEGVISPYMDFIAENRFDFNTRIYRIIMDETNEYVKKISATGASFPVNVPTGKFFDYSDASKYNLNVKDINIRFKCMGAMYNDDILIKEFNETSYIFNPELRKIEKSGFKINKGHTYSIIPRNLRSSLNYRGYPLINPNTLELNWWLDSSGDDSTTWKTTDNKIKD